MVSNYDMAHECMRTAERTKTDRDAQVEAAAATTYALLALVDELRAHRESGQDTNPVNFIEAELLARLEVA